MLAPAPTPEGLVFFPDMHRYVLDGKPVIGTTDALKLITDQAYRFVDPELMARKAAFGTAVHRLIELDCLGQLDLGDLDPALEPFYLGWRDFLAQSGFVVELSESKVCSRRLGVAGQLDLFGRLNGIKALVDAKCVAMVMPSTGPQTAGYELQVRESRPDLLPAGAPCRRYALQLRPPLHEGQPARWTLHPFTDPADLKVFLSCLTIAQYLRSLKP